MIQPEIKQLKYYKYKYDAFSQLKDIFREIYISRGRFPQLGNFEFVGGVRFSLSILENTLTVYIPNGVYAHVNIITGAVMLVQEGNKLIYLKDGVIQKINDALETLNLGTQGRFTTTSLIGAEYSELELYHFFEDIVIVSKFRG